MEKVRYYKDELNDDFAGNDIKTKKLPEDHKYIKKNPFWKVASFILYYIVALPIVTVYNKIVHGERIKNKRILKKYRIIFTVITLWLRRTRSRPVGLRFRKRRT